MNTLGVDRETDFSSAALVRRAEAIAPTLVPRLFETEKRSYYAEDTHEAFKRAGFYRILMPRAVGGLELDIPTNAKVAQAIARGCPSTAWMMCFSSHHAVNLCTMYEADVWPEIFGDGADFLSAMTVNPQGEIRQQADGTWRLSGTYDYCSGIPYSSHFSGQAIPVFLDGSKGRPVTFVAERKDWRMLDNWGDMLGLNGSGSHSIVFEDAVIPGRLVLQQEILTQTPGPRDPANPRHGDSPIYHGRFLSYLCSAPAAIAIGAVKGALDAYGELMKSRMTMHPPISLRLENTDYRRRFGTAWGQIAIAEAAHANLIEQWTELARQNMDGEQPFPIADEARLIYMAVEIVNMAWKAMDLIWTSAGSSAGRNGQRIQLIYRDMSMLRAHALSTIADPISRELSDQLLGVGGDFPDSYFGNSYRKVEAPR